MKLQSLQGPSLKILIVQKKLYNCTSRRRRYDPSISDVEVKNIGSVDQVGFTQVQLVKTLMQSLCFLTLPNIVPKQNYRFLKSNR